MIATMPVVGSSCGRISYDPTRDERHLAAGGSHSCAIVDGALYCWGANALGQLGVGDTVDRATPERVGEGSAWSQVALGDLHTCALRRDGTVHCWGGNDLGQLGIGSFEPQATPQAVTLPGRAAAIDGHFRHSCALLVDGTLAFWGYNFEGQFGLGDPVDAPPSPSPVVVSGDRPYDEVTCGQGHTLVRTGGELQGTGRNTDAELGLGAGAPLQVRVFTDIGGSPWARAAAGQFMSCAIRADATLWCWGGNNAGSLGTSDGLSHDTPTRIGADVERWDRLAIYSFGGCAISGGALYAWGRNVEGQLGTGDALDRATPSVASVFDDWVDVAMGSFHSCAQRADGSVWCSGDNSTGQLGNGDLVRRTVWTRVAL